jgi:hypothetical protein
MRFFTSERKAKRNAKRLKKALARCGQDLRYTKCLDLVARLYGYSHFAELKHSIWDGPFSPFDEDVDNQTLELRFQYQERVMAKAGFADIAGLVLDDINPTGRGKRRTALNDAAVEFANDATSTSNVS